MDVSDLEDAIVEADQSETARALAIELLRGSTFKEAVTHLDAEAERQLESGDRGGATDLTSSVGSDIPGFGWDVAMAAARLLRDLDDEHPEVRGIVEGRRARIALDQAQ